MHTSSRSSHLRPALQLCRGRRGGFGHQHISTRRRGESGSTLILVTVFVIALFGFAALTIDVGRVYKEKRHEQFATDAGAFAGVNMLSTNLLAATMKANAIQEATDIAGANSITASELANGIGGGVQVGLWDGTNFNADTTPYNAVRVSAARNVDMTFAKVVGFSTMNPAVHSIAALGTAGRVANPLPIAVTTNQVTGKSIGDFMDLNSDDVGSGKQGPVNLGNWQNGNEWQANMTINGCNCEVPVGYYPVFTGIDSKVSDAIKALGLNAIITVPVVDQIDTTGKKPAYVEAFITVQIINYSGSNGGKNWDATVMFLASDNGDQIGGNCPPGAACTQARSLVE